jgi:AhpD family alkylhydroperoxidase
MSSAERPTAKRVSIQEQQPGLMRAYLELHRAVEGVLNRPLHELVKIRASQLNHCAYCLEMHTRDGREAGLSEEKLDLLTAWREAPVFEPRERAALALTEAVTAIDRAGVPDDVWAAASEQFGDDELAALVMAVVTINGWNRIAVSTHTPVPRRSDSARR